MKTTTKQKITRVTEDQVSLVLQAIANVENWDGPRRSIGADSDGAWTMKRVNGIKTPCPSDKLLDYIKGLY